MEKAKRKEREFNMRRAAILAEAEKIFPARGYHNVTMAEIAKSSGFSVGSLYQFFESKEHLFVTMIDEKMALLYKAIRNEVETAKDIKGKIAALINGHLMFVEENKNFCSIFLLREQSESLLEIISLPALRQKLIEDYLAHLSFIEKILKEGVKKGMLRNLPTRDTARVLAYVLRAVSVDWVMMSSKNNPLSKKDFVMDIFLNGVKKHER